MTKYLGWFVAGAMTMLLIAASSGSFRLGDEPDLTSAFTYHGQLRSGGDPYSGLADVRLTLWNDAFTGVQVGRTVDFEAVAVEEGLFAVEPDFGPEAFSGARRWIEVAVRAPAGSGGYLTLDPRQAINATPYALYALNGRVGPEGPQGPAGEPHWELDEESNRLFTVAGGVGIGVTETTALLEVSGSSGDEAVMLPARSIGGDELANGLSAGCVIPYSYASSPSALFEIDIPRAGWLMITNVSNWTSTSGGSSEILVNGVSVLQRERSISAPGGSSNVYQRLWIGHAMAQVHEGTNTLELALYQRMGHLQIHFVSDALECVTIEP